MRASSPLRPSVFRLALRRQLVLALVLSLVTAFGVSIVVVCVVPVVFAWSVRTYRIAAGVLSAMLTWTALVFAVGIGLPSFVDHRPVLLIPASVAWATLLPVRLSPRNRVSDVWAYAGRLRRNERRSAS